MSLDTNIKCKKCNHEMTVVGELNDYEQWLSGMCMRCGHTLFIDSSYSSLEEVNEFRKNHIDEYKEIDELYLRSNRCGHISTRHKLLRLGVFDKETLDKTPDELLESFNPNWLNRMYIKKFSDSRVDIDRTI